MNQNGTAKTYDAEAMLRELRETAQEITDYPDLWLKTPHDILNGRSPMDFACADPVEGKALVLNLIGMIRHGMFT